MPTTQRLDGEDKDNERTQNLLVITTQEQIFWKSFRKQFGKQTFCLWTN